MTVPTHAKRLLVRVATGLPQLRRRLGNHTPRRDDAGTPVAGQPLDVVAQRLEELAQRLDAVDVGLGAIRQQLRYQAIATLADRLPADAGLLPFEMRVSSQNGEDGVLLEVLRRLGPGPGFFVEIGAHAAESNCVLLADALGWRGLIVEAEPRQLEGLRRKYSAGRRVMIVDAFVTRENIDAILREAEVPNEIDVFSVDIDGNDYWVWAAMAATRPRVVIIEYNASLGPDRALVQPYDADRHWDETAYFGASAKALIDLGRQLGYRPVHADLSAANLFFVRRELSRDLPELASVNRPVNYFLQGRCHRDAAPDVRWVDLDATDSHDRELTAGT